MTMTPLKAALLVVAFLPFKIPAFAKNHDPVQTLKMYFAPGLCSFRNWMIASGASFKVGRAAAYAGDVKFRIDQLQGI